jgi:hypothetical protein
MLLIGGGVLILGGTICFAGAWYVISNVDRWLVGVGREAIVAAVEETELPEPEKQEVIAQVDRVVSAYQERLIDQSDLERIMTELGESPALSLATLHGVDDYYLLDSDLSPAEQGEARRTYERVLRGVYERKISEDDVFGCLPEDDLEDAEMMEFTNAGRFAHVMQEADEHADMQGIEDDVRLVFNRFKFLADSVEIPYEPFRADIGDEVKRIVDTALAGKDVAAR